MMQVWLCEDDPIFRTSIESKISNWSKANHNFDLSITTFRSSEDLLEHWQLGNHADTLYVILKNPCWNPIFLLVLTLPISTIRCAIKNHL